MRDKYLDGAINALTSKPLRNDPAKEISTIPHTYNPFLSTLILFSRNINLLSSEVWDSAA